MAPPDPGAGTAAPARPSALRLEPYREDLAAAVVAFGDRLTAGGVRDDFRIGAGPARDDLMADDRPIRSETRLAVDADGAVRGGVLLHHQRFHTARGAQDVTNVQLPLSEGLVDRRFAFVGMWLVKSLQQRHPRLFSVGMGGLDQPLPKLYAALRWRVVVVPFLFRIHRPARVLRGMPAVRRGRARRVGATIAAVSGLGWAGLRALDAVRRVRDRRAVPRLDAERIDAWGAWADAIWDRARETMTLATVRDAAALAALHPLGDGRHQAWRLRDRDGADAGWVVLIRKAMRAHAQFGDLTVGTVLDCLAVPGREAAVARAAARLCARLDVDLSLTNQQHHAWVDAFRAAGYLAGPSNYLFAASPELARDAGDAADALARAHVTRGDGDGRINL